MMTTSEKATQKSITLPTRSVHHASFLQLHTTCPPIISRERPGSSGTTAVSLIAQLAQVLITDLQEGIDERDRQGPRPISSVRAGIIKLGDSYHAIQASEHRWFEAGAVAAISTGAPVAVHCEAGTAAHDILDSLTELGVPPAQVMLAHMDRNIDAGLHAEVVSRGAFFGYDTIGRTSYHSDAAVVQLIANVVAREQRSRILLGTDVGRRSMLRAYAGGPGMDVLSRTFLPRLSSELGSEVARALMIDNPRRFLTHGASITGHRPTSSAASG